MRASKLFSALCLTAGVLVLADDHATATGGDHDTAIWPPESVIHLQPNGHTHHARNTAAKPRQSKDSSIQARQTPCNPLDPGCWNGKRDTTSNEMSPDDWTDVENRDDFDDLHDPVPSVCQRARMACEAGIDCACRSDVDFSCDTNPQYVENHPGRLTECLCHHGLGYKGECHQENHPSDDSYANACEQSEEACTNDNEHCACGFARWCHPDPTIDQHVPECVHRCLLCYNTLEHHSECEDFNPLYNPWDSCNLDESDVNPPTTASSIDHHPHEPSAGHHRVPTEKGEAETAVYTSDGHTVTMMGSVSETSPSVLVVNMIGDGTTAIEIVSAMSDDPYSVVNTYVAGDGAILDVHTASYTTNPFTGDFMLPDLVKRGAVPTPTSTHATAPAGSKNGKATSTAKHRKHSKANATSKAGKSTGSETGKASPSKESKSKSKPKHHGKDTAKDQTTSTTTSLEQTQQSSSLVTKSTSTASPDSNPPTVFGTERKERQRVETVSILDEHPGHKTLDLEAATQTTAPTTKVTVISTHGSVLTLTPTTDSEGNKILITEDPNRFHRETCTVTQLIDGDDIETIMPSKTGRDMVTKTVRVHKSKPTINPFVAIPSWHSTSEAANPHHSHLATVTKVITQTVTKSRRSYCDHYDEWDDDSDWMMATKTMADLGSTTVPITKHMQLFNNSTMLIVPPHAEATLKPLEWDPEYLHGWEHVMDMSPESIRAMYPQADWEEVPRMAFHLRKKHTDLNEDNSLKYAMIMSMRGHRHPRHHRHYDYFGQAAYPTLSRDEYNATKMIAHISGTDFPITASTQTIAGHRYVVDPLMQYKMYDPLHHAVAPTGHCIGDNKHHGNKTQCEVERCMWEYMKPIQVTTVSPMAMRDHHGDVVYDYFTHETTVHRPHWGTRHTQGIYYPTKHTRSMIHGTPVHTVHRETPEAFNHTRREHKRGREWIHGNPHCWDAESCFRICNDPSKRGDDPFDWKKLLWISLPILAALLLAALCVLCCLRHRRRRRDPERRKSSIVPEKLRRKSSHKPDEVVVNQVTGSVTDPADHAVDPSTAVTTAVVAGSAAGAAAAGEKAGDHGHGEGHGEGGDHTGNGNTGNGGDNDGRGTTGRRAEEGRGKVNFADGGGAPGSDKAAGEGAPAAEGKPAESTEPVPVHDGTGDVGTGTGRQGPDVGSMRGRKRNRPEGGLNLGMGLTLGR